MKKSNSYPNSLPTTNEQKLEVQAGGDHSNFIFIVGLPLLQCSENAVEAAFDYT